MYSYEIIPSLRNILEKLSKKDRILYERVMSKIDEIINSNPAHYKNLKYTLKDRKRVHIGHFVLIFRFINEEKKIIFIDLEHHDRIYN